jgi:parallel beta-helix repeat protein
MNKMVAVLIVLVLLLSVIGVVPETVSAQAGVIRIKADGTVTGTDKIKQDGEVYTLTGDLYASVGQNEAFIFVEKNNITFDGGGYVVQGSGFGSAIYMFRSQNVTVQNFVISGFNTGVDFWIVDNWPLDANYLNQSSAFSNKILYNQIEVSSNADSNQNRDAGWCVYLSDAVKTVIEGNRFTCQNPQGGIYFSDSTKNTSIISNSFVGCGIYNLRSNQNTVYGNTVNGKPLVYLDSKSNQVVEAAGFVYLFNCSNIDVKNVNPLNDNTVAIQLVNTMRSDISNSSGQVLLVNSSYNNIHNNQLSSVTLDASSYNQVLTNKITNFSICIKMYGNSNFNKIYGNLLVDTTYATEADVVHKKGFNTIGIQFGDTQLGGVFNNDVQDNIIINHDCGFEFFLSTNNILTNNVIKDCKAGIQLGRSHFNTFTENNLTSCKYAISIYAESSNNTFYHNNFINNQMHCFETHQPTLLSDYETYSTGNKWDNGQTGNYWDTFMGIDENGDGISDIPYQVFENMTDNYPLMNPLKNSNTHQNNIPTYDPTTNRPTPDNNDTQTGLKRENIILISIVSVALIIIGGLIVYFRRLIFR